MTTLCILGGGASGVGLAWVLARAQQLGLGTQRASVEEAAAFAAALLLRAVFEMGGSQRGAGLAGRRRHLRQLEQLSRGAGRTPPRV